MKALDLIYAQFVHKGHLLVGFYPFDQDFVAAIPDQGDNILKHRPASWGAAIVQERAVDLHGVEIDQTKL